MSFTHFKGVSITEDGLASGEKDNEVLLFGSVFNGSVTWDASSIADGDEEVIDITVTGAVLGDFVLVSFSIDVIDLTLTAQVTADDTVTAQLSNNTGAGIDLGSGTVRARVLSRT